MMNDDDAPLPAVSALRNYGAALWRHASGAEPEFVCMATHISSGLFATVRDRGAVSDSGSCRYADLRLHLLDGSGKVIWAAWAAEPALQPLLFIGTDKSFPNPKPGTMTEIMSSTGENQRLWRIGYGRGVFANARDELARELEAGPRIARGYPAYDPAFTTFRGPCDANQSITPNIQCCFDYPGQKDLGAPVVGNKGQLFGVMVGGDLGSQSSHQGSYIPLEFITPFADLINEQRRANQLYGKGRRFDFVAHHEEEDEVAAPPANAR